MRKQSVIFYILGLLIIAVVAFVIFLTVNIVNAGASSQTQPEKPALDLPDDIPWGKIPWKEFPENFPWHDVPWEELPEDTDWEDMPWVSVPWDKLSPDVPADKIPWEAIPWEELPEDFAYDEFDWENFPWNEVPLNAIPWGDIPWTELPPDMPWTEIPWTSIPENFPWNEVPLNAIPWGDIPWTELPPDMPWTEIPWTSIPENFPWANVPWGQIPEDFPWESFGNGECPHAYSGGENNDGWITILEPTCSGEGTKSRTCIICRMPETESIPATGVHIFQNDICTGCQRHHIVLKSGSASGEYSGVPLKEESCSIVLGTLADRSHTIAGVYTQTGTVGIQDNIFTATVRDSSGADVTDLYIIGYEYGTLELTARSVTVYTGSAKKVYNGSALVCREFTAEGLAEGDEALLTFTGSQTQRGQSQNIATVKIVDRNGVDVTANYSVNIIFGTLTVE